LLDLFSRINILIGNPVLFHSKDLLEKEVMIKFYSTINERRDIIDEQWREHEDGIPQGLG
jgi:hypothetical protein